MANDKPTSDARTVQLKNVRLSFTDSLKEKKPTVDGGIPKHSLNIILETDKPEFAANKEKIRQAMEEAGERAWKKRDSYKTIMEDDPKRVCYRKGERFKNKDGEIYNGYAGNWGISCGTPGKSQNLPKILNRNRELVRDEDVLDVCYGGVEADVIISFYGTDKGGRGIFCTVDGIRSRERGERTGGGVYVDANDFEKFEDDDDDGDAFGGGEDPLG